jgi:hypothetical protein
MGGMYVGPNSEIFGGGRPGGNIPQFPREEGIDDLDLHSQLLMRNQRPQGGNNGFGNPGGFGGGMGGGMGGGGNNNMFM